MSPTMRGVDIEGGKGPATAMHITEMPRPKPKPNECLVQVKAFGLNRADTLQREGRYPMPAHISHIMGLEFSGTVVEAGTAQQGREQYQPGDAVFGLAYAGAYAQFVAVSAKMLCRKPAGLTWAQAAGVPETWITALQAIHLVGGFDPRAGDTSILWHAGASAVSIAGIQLARALGAAEVYATARSDAKCEFVVEELGATAAVNAAAHPPEGRGWAEEILRLTNGRGVDVIVDFVGGSYFAGNLEAAARDGRIVHLGMMGGSVVPSNADGGVDIAPFLRKRVRFEGSTLRSRDEDYQGKLRDLLEDEVLPKLVSGEFKIYIEKEMPWESIVEAHQLIESNKTKGKVVCTIG